VKNKELEEALSRYPTEIFDFHAFRTPVFFKLKPSRYFSIQIRKILFDNKELDIKSVY